MKDIPFIFYSTGSYDFYTLAPVGSANLPVVLWGAIYIKIKQYIHI